MSAFLADWASLVVRWIHVIAAIAWIGHAFFFHSIHEHMAPPEKPDPKGEIEGEMWMIHGGGLFFLRKLRTVPKEVVRDLLWFKWEAGFTWLSGFLLLCVVFYGSGGVYLVDPSVAPISRWEGVGIGLGTLSLGWLVYDAIWMSPLAEIEAAAAALSVSLLVGIAYGLTHVLSGRAAYIHVGGLLATCMAANVWMRIIPSQRQMVAAMAEGRPPDERLASRAAKRSKHNGYMQFPVIFIMISNHYPATYGHSLNWVVLLLVMIVGAAARQLLLDRGRSHPAVYGVIGVAVLPLAFLTMPRTEALAEVTHGDHAKVDPSTTGSIRGVVRFAGAVPPAAVVDTPGCAHDAPVLDPSLQVDQGRVANAIVWLKAGAERWEAPPPPTSPVVIDQKGCMYAPRVAVARAGQPVEFRNSDALVHNVRTLAGDNEPFNELLAAQGQSFTRTFQRPQVAVKAKCDVHPWMSGFVGVVDHPWAVVTGPDGAFTLDGVPPGDYTLAAWHETLGAVDQPVTVKPHEAAGADLSFPEAR